ncbi:MAG: nicotinate-nucleotide adenylyltransferase [Chloroflexi bacterium]|nr:nicotinate-nucleotide adenylyltransferase [Chloroflexota bacterium]
MRRLGIMGGTFDPPHTGHLAAAEMARAELGLERILWVPANRSPWKMSRLISTTEQRLELVRLAIAGHAQFELSRVDVDRPAPSYTYETLGILAAQNPDAELFFIMGLDSLRDLGNWHRAAEIVRLARLVVCARPGVAMDVGQMMDLLHGLPDLFNRLTFVEMPELEIAASNLQERVRRGQSIRYLVPDAVRDYIEANRLYRDS